MLVLFQACRRVKWPPSRSKSLHPLPTLITRRFALKPRLGDFSIKEKPNLQKLIDRENLGDPGGGESEEHANWEDILVDGALPQSSHYNFDLRLVGPCPEGFTHHNCWVIDDMIWCFNPTTKKMEFFDPENEVWVDKEKNKVNITQKLDDAFDAQITKVSSDHFVLWARSKKYDRGNFFLFDKELSTPTSLPKVLPLAREYAHAKFFSVGTLLMLQGRFRPTRDTFDTLFSRPGVDSEMIHKDTGVPGTRFLHDSPFSVSAGYDIESLYSNLWFYNYETTEFEKVRLKGQSLACCTTLVKSEDEKHLYFLSRLNQGYCVNTENWKVAGLSLIGRPNNLSIGTAAAMIDPNLIVAVGGGWPTWESFSEAITQSRRKASIVTESPTLNRYSPRIAVLDLKKKKWFIPRIQGDKDDWKPLGFSVAVPWKNKLFIIGGENVSGETKKVWVLERLEGLSEPEQGKETKELDWQEEEEKESERTKTKVLSEEEERLRKMMHKRKSL